MDGKDDIPDDIDLRNRNYKSDIESKEDNYEQNVSEPIFTEADFLDSPNQSPSKTKNALPYVKVARLINPRSYKPQMVEKKTINFAISKVSISPLSPPDENVFKTSQKMINEIPQTFSISVAKPIKNAPSKHNRRSLMSPTLKQNKKLLDQEAVPDQNSDEPRLGSSERGKSFDFRLKLR